MLDPEMLTELKDVFRRLEHEVKLVYYRSTHDKQAELMELLTQMSSVSPLINLEELEDSSSVPRFFLRHQDRDVGIKFTGIPGGHEFSSLVLAILNADGQGKLPDAGMTRRIRGLKGPIRLRTFVSLSCENCPGVVQALNLMASLHPDFEHEMVDGEFAMDEVSALGVQGVPSVIHDGKLVSSGKTTLAELLGRLEARVGKEAVSEGPIDLGEYRVTVIGAGPAGVAAAIYTARKGLKTAIISDRIGGQLQDTKGIENLISVPYTEGPKLSHNLGEHMAAYDIDVLEHRRVAAIAPKNEETGLIELKLESGEVLRTRALIIATGAKWRELGVAGEKEYLGRGVAFCPHCDGPYYKGKDIAVIGGGNSGVEAALDLAGIVKSVTVFEFLPELKADAVLINKLLALPNARIIKNARTNQILGNGDGVTGIEYEDRATKVLHQVALEGVFVQIGLVPNSAFVREIVETNRFGEIVVDNKGHTSRPGIYAAGDVTTVPYKQIVVAMGEGAKAGLAAFEDQTFGPKP
ncbi:MAG: alkyl hydroperoxide reductase subunit F [Deltaproteobacteria bacterium]|nr:alkyl hydroperoxide reductase subunit F [Deltaproteobacteria bacterium]